MFDHISKPLHLQNLFETLAKWISPANPIVKLETKEANLSEKNSVALVLPDKLPGINMKVGLATTMNNIKLYHHQLIMFYEGQSNFAEHFNLAFSRDDLTVQALIAHTLKGNAGNIGANAVYTAAGKLERACHKGSSPEIISQLLTETLIELNIVISGLVSIANAKPLIMASESISDDTFKKLAQQLQNLLEDDDTSADEILEELLQAKYGTTIDSLLEKIHLAVRSYDFESALELMKELPC